MRLAVLILATGLTPLVSSPASDADWSVSRGAAFYEGEKLNYVIPPPPEFKYVNEEAVADGYSLAFVPESLEYAKADVLIGVNIYKIRGLDFEDVVRQDTASFRKHYGERLSMWEVDSVTIGSHHPVKTFYFNDSTQFIPNVMVSYLNGHTELLIFELVISENVLRVAAEETYLTCLRTIKALIRGELGAR